MAKINLGKVIGPAGPRGQPGSDIIQDPEDERGGIIVGTTDADIDIDPTLTVQGAAADAKAVGQELNNKLTQPETAPTVGKVLKVKSVNEDGTFVCEWADGGSGGVTDVKVNNATVVADGVANIPLASESSAGVGTAHPNYGIKIQGGRFVTVMATTSNIDSHSGDYRVITPGNLNYAVTAALTDAKHITLTSEQQQTAQEVLGILSVEGVTY